MYIYIYIYVYIYIYMCVCEHMYTCVCEHERIGWDGTHQIAKLAIASAATASDATGANWRAQLLRETSAFICMALR